MLEKIDVEKIDPVDAVCIADILHDHYAELGRKGGKVTTAKKRAANKRNIAKRWAKKTSEKLLP